MPVGDDVAVDAVGDDVARPRGAVVGHDRQADAHRLQQHHREALAARGHREQRRLRELLLHPRRVTAQAGAVRDAELVGERLERVLLRPGAEDVQAPVRVLVRHPRPGHAAAGRSPCAGRAGRPPPRPWRRARRAAVRAPAPCWGCTRSACPGRAAPRTGRGLLRQRADGHRAAGRWCGDRRAQAGLVAAEVHVVLPDAHDRRAARSVRSRGSGRGACRRARRRAPSG